LFKSSKAGSLTGVRNALNNGAKPNYFYNPEDSKNALHIAAEEGHLEIVRELLDHGAEIESIVKGSKETALLLAARELHLHVIQYLIERGANCAAGESGVPPLCLSPDLSQSMPMEIARFMKQFVAALLSCVSSYSPLVMWMSILLITKAVLLFISSAMKQKKEPMTSRCSGHSFNLVLISMLGIIEAEHLSSCAVQLEGLLVLLLPLMRDTPQIGFD
jgi:hypothetical protein